MAESKDAVDLGTVLTLCGFGFNERARIALLELLPSTLGEEVVAAWRQGDELWKTAGYGLEATLAAPWVALKEAEQADGERREAENPTMARKQAISPQLTPLSRRVTPMWMRSSPRPMPRWMRIRSRRTMRANWPRRS